jgi:ABC-type antimicrobial peptide transport system permease subunit
VRLFVFAIPDGQWWLFPALVALMGAAGAVACWMPTRRALAIQPVQALKADS